MNSAQRIAKTIRQYVMGRRVDVDLAYGGQWALEEVRVHGLRRQAVSGQFASEEAALDQARQIAWQLIGR